MCVQVNRLDIVKHKNMRLLVMIVQQKVKLKIPNTGGG